MTEEEIADVVSKWTHIPVSRMLEGEKEKLLRKKSKNKASLSVLQQVFADAVKHFEEPVNKLVKNRKYNHQRSMRNGKRRKKQSPRGASNSNRD